MELGVRKGGFICHTASVTASIFPLQDPRSNPLQFSHGSLPRNSRISVPPDVSSSAHSQYHPQPIISRISIPPASPQSRQRGPIPLSVILRLQNPHWRATMPTPNPRVMGGDGDKLPYQPAAPVLRELFHQHVPLYQPHQQPPELRQPAVYSDGKNTCTLCHHVCNKFKMCVHVCSAEPGGC